MNTIHVCIIDHNGKKQYIRTNIKDMVYLNIVKKIPLRVLLNREI